CARDYDGPKGRFAYW
nr:immunoglobulin heavy chain junction region [Mus musculus]